MRRIGGVVVGVRMCEKKKRKFSPLLLKRNGTVDVHLQPTFFPELALDRYLKNGVVGA